MFVHLHVHSNYSFCRGASRIENLVDAALARGMSAMALTDTNGVYGLIWFLQYAAEIAPPGRTGIYMGVAQFPWFMTKMLVPLYSGYMLQRYCPADSPNSS